jgi:hypothetical protein
VPLSWSFHHQPLWKLPFDGSKRGEAKAKREIGIVRVGAPFGNEIVIVPVSGFGKEAFAVATTDVDVGAL